MKQSGVADLKWLTDNHKMLAKYRGKWIAFTVEKGLIVVADALSEAVGKAKKVCKNEEPCFFKVPRPDEKHMIL